MSEFCISVRVYHEDTDGGGIVYYANYLRFMERARTEYLRSLGVEQDVLVAEYQRMFVVTHCEIAYRRPAVFNDLLLVNAVPSRWRRASMEFKQVVTRGNEKALEAAGEILCEATVQLACLDSESYRPAAMPPQLVALVGRPS